MKRRTNPAVLSRKLEARRRRLAEAEEKLAQVKARQGEYARPQDYKRAITMVERRIVRFKREIENLEMQAVKHA